MEKISSLEVAEGNVRISSMPAVYINDKPFLDCSREEIEKEVLALVRRIIDLRKRLGDGG
jgi:hypothetical protein